MAIGYQDVNELLAKGTKKEYMSLEAAKEIEDANLFLLQGVGKKPIWLEQFFESNKCKLVETICRATSETEGISSLSGYQEGYFNEIVQNASDLHCGTEMIIDVSKRGELCRLDCNYQDQGFQLSNLYAFLNREMSDKLSENGQTGKFGVGIKSFFKFVTALEIDSNVRMSFQIDRHVEDIQIKGEVALNECWDRETTTMSFEYQATGSSEFNTRKLTRMVEGLCSDQIEIDKFFVTGADHELVFDLRSLIFMQIKGAKQKSSISKIVFRGSRHQVEINCQDIYERQLIRMEQSVWEIKKVCLSVILDHNLQQTKDYLVFIGDGLSFGFPIAAELSDKNRWYNTYYLKTDLQQQILPLGMLVDLGYSNIHRTDLGDSEESIGKVYQLVKEKMLQLYRCMCSESIAKLQCAKEISDVFHSLLARFLYVDKLQHMESPLNDLDLDNCFMFKTSDNARPYVVVHQLKEYYDSTTYIEGDISRELRESYFYFVEKQEVIDFHTMMEEPPCINGVHRIYKLIDQASQQPIPEFAENIIQTAKIINYFKTVQSFLSYKISGEKRDYCDVTDAEIDHWLLQMQKEAGRYFNPVIFLKLVGRYRLNSAISFDGTILSSKLSFKDYLFYGMSELENGILAKYQKKQFDEKYSLLKCELLRKRYTDSGNNRDKYAVRCIVPCKRSLNGWDGRFDYYEMSIYEVNQEQLSQPQLLLEKIALDPSFQGMIDPGTMRLFEKRAAGMNQRWNYSFKNFTVIEQQIIDLSCLRDIKLNSFSEFMESVKYRAMLEVKLATQINISCFQEKVTTQNIAVFLLPVFIEGSKQENKTSLLELFEEKDVEIRDVEENTNNEMQEESGEFILKVTGYKLHLYHFDSHTRKKIIAYFGGGRFAVRMEAAEPFIDAAQYTSNKKDVYIFYDNFHDHMRDTIAVVLAELGISQKTLELLQGYIHNGNNTKVMNYFSRQRSIAKVRKKLVLDWCKISSKEVSAIYDNEILYRLLTARGSYDIFCPICADIPLEEFFYGEETKKKHSRKIIVLENENLETKECVPYIITVACSYCYEKLRNTLYHSEFDGKNLILTTLIAHGRHEKMKSKQQIELSPINIELMNKFTM